MTRKFYSIMFEHAYCFQIYASIIGPSLVTPSNEKKDVGMAKHSLKSTETRDELQLPSICKPKLIFCSIRMPVNA